MRRKNTLIPNAETVAEDVKQAIELIDDALETAKAWAGYHDGEQKCEIDAITNQIVCAKRKMVEVIVHARTVGELYD